MHYAVALTIYLLINGAMKDFLFQYFIFNAQYASSGMTVQSLLKNIIITISRGFFWLALSGSMFCFLKTKGSLKIFHGSCFVASIVTIVFIVLSNATYSHYSMIIVPLAIIQIGLLSDFLYKALKRNSAIHTALYVFMIFGVIFAHPIAYCIGIPYSVITAQKNDEMQLLSDIIKENSNDNDTIISLGNNCQVYLYTDLKPTSKYIYQPSQVFNELKSDMLNRMPNIIVIHNNSNYAAQEYQGLVPENVKFINNLLDTEYIELASTANYKLYKKL